MGNNRDLAELMWELNCVRTHEVFSTVWSTMWVQGHTVHLKAQCPGFGSSWPLFTREHLAEKSETPAPQSHNH